MFKIGDQVLIPAVVSDRTILDGSRAVIVTTAGGNRVREPDDVLVQDQRASDIAPTASLASVPLASVEERVERLARAMAIADDVNPDDDATSFTPDRRAGGWVIGGRVGAWRLYAKYARAIIDAKLA